eukprot:gene22502-29139_t
MKIGYARVSTKHQRESLDHQIALLKKSGCAEIFSEIISGANSKRPELTKLLNHIKSGNTLVITSIDRLGRSLIDLINIIGDLKEKSVIFQTLKEQMDTSTPTGMLMFNMMGSIAEFERTLINRRVYDGVQRAKEQGKFQGRRHSVDEKIRKDYVKMVNSGDYPISYVSKMAKASLFDIYRLNVAMTALLEQPDKIANIKRNLKIGMHISYFSVRQNKLVDAVIEEIQRTNVYVRDKRDGQKWGVPFYALNLSNVNTDIHTKQPQEKYDRNQFHVGEHISFLGKNEIETYGIITQLNPKTASIVTRDKSRWRVSYSHLFKIVDGYGTEMTPRQMIDVTVIPK